MIISRLQRSLWIFGFPLFLSVGLLVFGQGSDDELLERARELRSNEIFLESVRIYRSYVAENPEDRDVRVELAGLLLQLDDPFGAADTLVPVLKEDPTDTEARGIFNRSLELLEEGDAETEPVRVLQAARLYRFSGQPEAAEPKYREYLELEPGNAVAAHELAQMLYDQGETEAAFAELENALAVAEEEDLRRDLLLKRAAWLSYDPERQAEAPVVLDQFLEEYPEDPDARFRLANLYRYQGRYAEARAAYAEVLRADNRNQEAAEGYYLTLLRTRALERARIARMDGDPDEAIRLYEAHFEEMAMTEERLEMIRRLEAEGRATEEHLRVAEYFRRFLADTPPEADVRLEIASIAAEQGRNREAIDQTQRAVELRPNDRDLRLQLAQYQTFEEESLSDAAATLAGIEESFGPDAEVAAMRGDILRFGGEYKEALESYKKTLERNPDDPRALAGIEWIDSLFVPEFYGGLGFTRDWSSDYDHWNADVGIRNIFSAIEHRIDAQYRFLYYRQPVSTQNPNLSNNREKVVGNELNATVSGPITSSWSYLVNLGGVLYDHVEGTVLGRLGLGYSTDDLSAAFGFRRREAVVEHYDLSALLAGVRTNDFFAQAIYVTPREDVWERWQLEGYGETGWFDDGNYRSRVRGTMLNRILESDENSLKLGVTGLYLDYSEDSPNYFSPSHYWGVGVTGRYDHEFNESTDGGLTGTALWIEQVREFDLAVGGYLDHQITDSARASLRLDYGESTFPDGDIRSFSGRAEVQILF